MRTPVSSTIALKDAPIYCTVSVQVTNPDGSASYVRGTYEGEQTLPPHLFEEYLAILRNFDGLLPSSPQMIKDSKIRLDTPLNGSHVLWGFQCYCKVILDAESLQLMDLLPTAPLHP